MTLSAPHWDMTNVYPSLESKEFQSAFDNLKTQLSDLEDYFVEVVDKADATKPAKALGAIIGETVEKLNSAYTLTATLSPYISCHVNTDSRDKNAARIQSEFQKATVPLSKLGVRFTDWLGKLEPVLDTAITHSDTAQAHAFNLKEAAEQSKYLMSQDEEGLAAELTLSGARAWSKLQGTITSQLSVDFELDGKTEKLPMPALINLRTHADEATRHRAYDAENVAWDSVREALAACLNGVKGEVITLNKRRGREDALHSALDAARIDRPTLEAMLSAMKDSFPIFQKYFKHKAKLLGKEKLAWWDIYAPVGSANKTYLFEEARDFVLKNFDNFSSELTQFAKRAFENNWIDAEQRDGKRGGGYCTEVQGKKESRILINFDGDRKSVV